MRLYTEQMEPPQQLANGWLRVHVLSTVYPESSMIKNLVLGQ